MAERYDSNAARHYAAYRPPLHEVILQRLLSAHDSFGAGLDIGCGTGASAVALAPWCGRVYGIDSSLPMLRRATVREKVTYLVARSEHIPLQPGSVDVVTFAGSLFYTDRKAAAAEVRRVARRGAIVIVYDFEVLIADAPGRPAQSPDPAAAYDHAVNFSGTTGFVAGKVERDRLKLSVTATQLAHLMLSDSTRFDEYVATLHTTDPFPVLVAALQSRTDQGTIEADIFYAAYRV